LRTITKVELYKKIETELKNKKFKSSGLNILYLPSKSYLYDFLYSINPNCNVFKQDEIIAARKVQERFFYI